MKDRASRLARNSSFAVLACAITMLATANALANGVNQIPSQWDFEDQAVGTAIVDTNGVGILGWEGTPLSPSPTNNAAEVVTANPPEPPNGWPIPAVGHTNAMQILRKVMANFNTNQTAGATNVYIDCVVQAGRLSFTPDAPEGAQVAAFFNTNGLLVLYHAQYTNNGISVTRMWTEVAHTPVGSNDWARLTITMDYYGAGDPFSEGEHFYTVELNGERITSSRAYANPVISNFDFPDPAGPGETNMWFMCGDSGYGTDPGNTPNNQFFSGIELDGAGTVEDLIVTATGVTPYVPTAYDIWADDQGIPDDKDGPGQDADEDGASNFDEYVAGTDPNDPDSYFHIIQEVYSVGDSNLVVWLGGLSSSNITPYMIMRSTNLMEANGGWTLVASNIARNVTNKWLDLAPPQPRAFYLPVLPTNAP